MSHLLKRTKKTCLKFIRKLSSSKQLYIKQMEDDDLSMKTTIHTETTTTAGTAATTTNPGAGTITNDHKSMEVRKSRDNEDNTHRQFNATNDTMPFSSYCWKSYDPDDTDNETDEEDGGKRHRNMILESLTSKLFITANGYEFQRMQQSHNEIETSISDVLPSSKKEATTVQEQQKQSQQQQQLKSKQKQEQSFDQSNERALKEAAAAVADVHFERVKYKEHVRYFRRTPSTSSLDNFVPQCNTLNGNGQSPVRTSLQPSPLLPPPPATSLSAQSQSSSATSSSTISTSKTDTTMHHHNHHQNQFQQQQQQQQYSHPHHTANESNSHSMFLDGSNYFLPINLSLGSKRNGNYQNVYISEERDSYNKKTPIVKWDINGNSLDDDNIFISDNWCDYDGDGNVNATFTNYAYDKRCAQLKYDGSQKSNSYRSSSTTLETWLEDEYADYNNGDQQSLRNHHNEFPSNSCLMKT